MLDDDKSLEVTNHTSYKYRGYEVCEMNDILFSIIEDDGEEWMQWTTKDDILVWKLEKLDNFFSTG